MPHGKNPERLAQRSNETAFIWPQSKNKMAMQPVKSPNANGSQEELLKVNDKSFEQFVEA
jgi:hypothetical protein